MNRTGALTVASAGRRYVLLTALRWLPLGITIPVTVLLASSRGLSTAEIGLVFVAHSVVALVFELPTGGLADAIGRRPVLVLSALLHIAGLLTLAAAQGLVGFATAFALVGAGRALDSGPLESWYVDAVHQLDRHADVTPGLSRAAVADGAGLALGAVVGGFAPSLFAGAGADNALALPFLVAAAIDVVYLVGVLALVAPLGPAGEASTIAALRTGVASVPAVVRDTLSLAARDRALRLLLMITFLVGVVLSTLELIGPLQFAELTGSRTDGTAVFGVVMAVSFGAAAAGAAMATTARRLAGGSVAWATAVLFGLCALAVIGIGLTTTVLLAGVAYAAFYLVNAIGWPLRQQLMHSRVDASRRSTTVSAKSFALMLGGITGSLLIPALAEATSFTGAFLAAAGALLVACLLSLRLPPGPIPPRAAAAERAATESAGSPLR